MEYPFIFDKEVTDKNIIGRGNNCLQFKSYIKDKKNIALYDCPKSGKKTLIGHCFSMLKHDGYDFISIKISLLKIRELSDFVCQYLQALKQVFPKDSLINELHTNALSNIFNLDEVLEIAYTLANQYSKRLIIVFEEFQNINYFTENYRFLSTFQKLVSINKDSLCSFIFTGSMLNDMKYIFEHKKWFYKDVEIITLEQLNEKDIIDYVYKGFLQYGKSIEKSLVGEITKVFKNNPYYINHLCFICDHLSKGYISNNVVDQAIEYLVSIYEPHFIFVINNLTNHQISLLRAIIEGHQLFSSTNVIEEYNLNSSANVKRVKEALCKKEIIACKSGKYYIIDCLFEYWLINKYFV